MESQIKFSFKISKYQPIVLREDQISHTSAREEETNKCVLLLFCMVGVWKLEVHGVDQREMSSTGKQNTLLPTYVLYQDDYPSFFNVGLLKVAECRFIQNQPLKLFILVLYFHAPPLSSTPGSCHSSSLTMPVILYDGSEEELMDTIEREFS